MGMSLGERLAADRAKKLAEAQAKLVPTEPPKPAIVAASPEPEKVAPAAPAKPGGRLAGLLGKNKAVGGATAPVAVTVTALPVTKQATGQATAPQAAKVVVPEPPKADLSDEDLATFKRQLRYLEENIEQKELIGQVVRTIMMMWRKNPQFSSSMTDADEEIVARGFMRAFNVAARRKTEDQGKKTAKKASISELDELMKGAGFNVGDPLGKMFGG